MTITINATGAERKRLVQTIAQWLGCEAKYLGVPSCAYQVDYFTIEKNGSLTFDDSADSEVIERLLQHIYDEGFDIDRSRTEDEEEITGVCISIASQPFHRQQPGKPQGHRCRQGQPYQESPRYGRASHRGYRHQGFLPLVRGNTHP